MVGSYRAALVTRPVGRYLEEHSDWLPALHGTVPLENMLDVGYGLDPSSTDDDLLQKQSKEIGSKLTQTGILISKGLD